MRCRVPGELRSSTYIGGFLAWTCEGFRMQGCHLHIWVGGSMIDDAGFSRHGRTGHHVLLFLKF